MTAELLELELEPDPGWYEIPEDSADFREWALGLVRQLAGPDADEDAVRASAEVVLAHAWQAADAMVELAWVFLPDPLDQVLASCHVELVFGTAGDLPSLAEIVASLERRLPDHIDEPHVREELLTAGRSVRQQLMRTHDDGEVVEAVTYVVVVPELDDALLRITTSWRALALGEVLTEQADRMAAGIVVRTS